MTLKEYREKINPCYGYGCYDEDFGCTIPGGDTSYACPLNTDYEMEYTNDD